jgi:hypothetical protein
MYEVRSLDGMWNVGDFRGSLGGAPYQGLYVVGYDRALSRYVTYWYDSMSSRPISAEGTWDDAHRTLTVRGKCVEPSGQEVDMTQITEIKGPNDVIFKVMKPGHDGTDALAMQIDYKRK